MTSVSRRVQLFIDLDGVLADFDGHYEAVTGIRPDRHSPEPADFWRPIEANGTFFRDLPLLPDALDMWRAATVLHPNPIILTGLPRIDGIDRQKREWVAEHISPTATVICCRSADKRNHGRPGDILVDDWHKYRSLWEEMGGIFVLHSSAQESIYQVTMALIPKDQWQPLIPCPNCHRAFVSAPDETCHYCQHDREVDNATG